MQHNDYLAEKVSLPDWFEYPTGFRILVEHGIVDFPPWRLANVDFALTTYFFLRERYGRELFPLAHRQGSDDVACLEEGGGETVLLINGYTCPGRENEGAAGSFWNWFRSAIDEMIEFYG